MKLIWLKSDWISFIYTVRIGLYNSIIFRFLILCVCWFVGLIVSIDGQYIVYFWYVVLVFFGRKIHRSTGPFIYGVDKMWLAWYDWTNTLTGYWVTGRSQEERKQGLNFQLILCFYFCCGMMHIGWWWI